MFGLDTGAKELFPYEYYCVERVLSKDAKWIG
jgi:hypothetical protein